MYLVPQCPPFSSVKSLKGLQLPIPNTRYLILAVLENDFLFVFVVPRIEPNRLSHMLDKQSIAKLYYYYHYHHLLLSLEKEPCFGSHFAYSASIPSSGLHASVTTPSSHCVLQDKISAESWHGSYIPEILTLGRLELGELQVTGQPGLSGKTLSQ